ncbi:MAG: cupin domain-containing protein [Clostridia bacterium]|jgi:quercetin dioxygenase-like cupin family protein
MIEQVFKLFTGDTKAIEKVIFDENLHYIHLVFTKNDGLPEHYSNSNVYMTVIRGNLTIGLGDQQVKVYEKGTLLKIPKGTLMNVMNNHHETLEIIIVKAPSPDKQIV